MLSLCFLPLADWNDAVMQNVEHRVEDVLKMDADLEGKNSDDPYDSTKYGMMVPY